MSDFTTKFMEKYNASMSQLHQVGADYVNASKDNEKARENLFKVYRGYSIASVIVSYGLLILSVVMVLMYHHYGWLAILPLAIILPKAFEWAMQNVLNIRPSEYHEWKKAKKAKS